MYCPTCAAECNDERNFCNACGTNINIIKKTVSIAKNTNMANPEQIKRFFILEKEWNNFLSKGLIIICLGLLYSTAIFIIGFLIKKYFNAEIGRLLKDLSIFGTLFLLAGIMIIAYGRIKFRSKSTDLAIAELFLDENQVTNTSEVRALPSENTPNFNNYMPFSVTEHTTKELNFIPVPDKTKKG